MYRILIERRAEKDLDDLPAKIFRQITCSIQKLAENPRLHGSKKLKDSQSDYRIRVGDYRVLYDINDRTKLVRVFRIKHRGQAYH